MANYIATFFKVGSASRSLKLPPHLENIVRLSDSVFGFINKGVHQNQETSFTNKKQIL